jgi:pimeloyl-ACP methyl ester carboxylesterase
MLELSRGDAIVLGILDVFVRNWALIGIVVTLILLAGLPAVILRKYVKIIVNIFQEAPVPLAMDTRDYRRTQGEPIEFRAFDGHRLCGMFHPANPDQPLRGTIVFAHELNSDLHSATRYCSALLDAGYEVFAFDFRGQGKSAAEDGHTSRLWPSDREVSDMLGAIAYVEDCLETRGRPRFVGLVGVSRGAGAAILAAVNLRSVKAIMIDGGFSTDAYLEYLMQRWVGIFAKVRLVYENHRPAFWRFLRWLSVRKASRNLGCRFPSVRKAVPRLGNIPMLIIHGEKDGHIPVAQARLIHDLAEGPKYLWICPRAKHNQAVVVQPKLYGQYSVRFFDQHLAGIVRDELPGEDGLCCQLPKPLSQPTRLAYAFYTKPQRPKRKAASGTPSRR